MPFISPAFNLRFAVAEQRQEMISPFVSRQPQQQQQQLRDFPSAACDALTLARSVLYTF
jgi:hypothetical protein